MPGGLKGSIEPPSFNMVPTLYYSQYQGVWGVQSNPNISEGSPHSHSMPGGFVGPQKLLTNPLQSLFQPKNTTPSFPLFLYYLTLSILLPTCDSTQRFYICCTAAVFFPSPPHIRTGHTLSGKVWRELAEPRLSRQLDLWLHARIELQTCIGQEGVNISKVSDYKGLKKGRGSYNCNVSEKTCTLEG